MMFSELNAECFSEVIKKYNKELYAESCEAGISYSGIETFLRRHYPMLALRNITEGSDRSKNLYIAMTALLYYCCIRDKSGAIASGIRRDLDKVKIQMITKVCEKLRTMEMKTMNILSAIKDAYNETFGASDKERPKQKSDERKLLLTPDKEITGIPATKDRSDTKRLFQRKSTSTIDLKTGTSKRESLGKTSRSTSSPLVNKDDALVFEPYIPQKKLVDQQDNNMDQMFRKRPSVTFCTDDDEEQDLEMDVLDDSCTPCQPNCTCTKCSSIGPSCGDPGYSMEDCDTPEPDYDLASKDSFTAELVRGCDWKMYCALVGMIFLAVVIVLLCSLSLWDWSEQSDSGERMDESTKLKRLVNRTGSAGVEWQWQCSDQFCTKAHVGKNATLYSSLSRCTLLCMGPQLWPYPIGYTHYSQTLVALTTTNLEYKFQSVPSEIVHSYLAEAFKLFLKGLFRLEKIDKKKKNESEKIDLPLKRISVHIEVENDPDPRLRLNTEEAYMLNFETIDDRVIMKVISGSFCGVRHGLETASQLILLDQATGYLLSLSEITIKDAPSYRYRGLMIDTGRNFITVSDITRTLDAMAACKLNTLHWRISSDTSFPLYLTKLPLLSEYGAYDRSMIYTKDDVKNIVRKAGLRGIRVLIEVTAPGPVGRPWSWSAQATCPMKTDNYTCDNVLCTRLLMEKSVFDTLQVIYTEILQMTGVDDIFHLSDGMFSMTNCYQLISDRDGFLDKALERLKLANRGFVPKLPIIWYTPHLMKDSEARTWERLGVQLNQWEPNPGEQYLGKFRVIHSTNWDLSCEISKHRCVKFRSWQEMYSWKSWRNVEVFTIEGGEAILWTDLVGAGNLDYTLWPRAAAVAERLWSDTNANSTANRYVYVRLDTQREAISGRPFQRRWHCNPELKTSIGIGAHQENRPPAPSNRE
ncbi:unnamed protein product, partial [Iphiclides podalirius]